MSRRPARYTQADLARALRAAKAEGYAVEVLPDGTIRMVPAVENSKPRVEPERRIVL